ncbi:craniofacial development protein 1 [Anabrus simplex]|uniref:craniofacial development protein 1 n=1 Tax=Anabrus simplex TaxID=316456 RepID=UPI0035A37C8E
MDERELPSDSDESDEDYVPSDVESNPPSEEESGDEDAESAGSGVEEEGERENSGKRKKSQKPGKKKRKKKGRKFKKSEEVEGEEKIVDEEQKKLTEEEEKKKADSLWSDFMKDTGIVPRSKLSNGNSSKEETKVTVPVKANSEKENKVTITKVYEFAGEEVKITKQVDADSIEARVMASKETKPTASTPSPPPAVRGPVRPTGGLKGLSSVLGQLGKKPKLGTLEKSKLDWEKYKQAEGIQDELQAHNRGKDGYLEKQDFLQRTDLRQFEREKAMRASVRRSNR